MAYYRNVLQANFGLVVGVPGEGLNVEQRKRLTIGVEMAAKPALLLFLDEPTSGLDSQTAWSILALLRKLANNGQAVLCTIHQPSAILFQEFDRLLFLATGGKTVYFGEIGEHSKTLIDYFVNKGGRPCGPEENPAEWMLDVIGAARNSTNTIDWPVVWNESPERAQVKRDLAEMKEHLLATTAEDTDNAALRAYAVSFTQQWIAVQHRIFQQFWRTPSYLYSKIVLVAASALFIGFSFWHAGTSLQGLQNQLFSVFMLLTMFSNLCQQMMPHFVTQRALYEVRERPSKTYSWQVFMLSNIFVEFPWQILAAVIVYFCWYYPIGYYQNAVPADQVTERGGLMFLYLVEFMLFTSTFTHLIIAASTTAEAGGNIANLTFSLSLIFCGVLAGPNVLPGFWIFMFRVSPFTYLVEGILAVALANTKVVCDPVEFLKFSPPSGEQCGTYMARYIDSMSGYLSDQSINSTTTCEFCSIADTNTFLTSVYSEYSERWRNFGLLWVYVIFNIFGAILLYWIARVPKGAKKAKKEKKA